MMINKSTKLLALALAAAMPLTGCGAEKQGGNGANAASSGSGKLSIVCTIFPEYDWVRSVMGDHAAEADITYLLDSGTDLHNFQPTAADMLKIATCDLFIHVGGESDKWVEDALSDSENKDMKVLNLMELIGDSVKEEELKEGMESDEHDHDHDEDDHDEDDHNHEEEEGPEYDEHIWLSLRNAKAVCAGIADALSEKDPKNTGDYKENLAAYSAKLDELDGKFSDLTSKASNKTLIFGDRFPFRYFTDDYGLDYYAAFVGCSAESEASFKTISFLSDKLKETGCPCIFTIENSDKSIAEAIIRNSGRTDCETAELNSIQSVASADVKSGVTYLSLMEQNYDVLEKYLS